MNYKRVILIITDTLRADYVGVNKKGVTLTPNIDKLAEGGLNFVNAYSTITCTDPAITAIMTGRYPQSAGLVNHGRYIKEDEIKSVRKLSFIAEILKNKGFKTMAVDWLKRWHKKGFSYYSGSLSKADKFDIADKFPFPLILRIIDKVTVKLLGREFFVRFYFAFFKNAKLHYDPADKVITRGINLLKKNKQEKTFLYLHLWDAHAPHVRPKGLKSYLRDNVRDTYRAEVVFMDGQIGRLVDFLNESKLLDQTLIVLTSDHGENLDTHDIPFNHENLYDDVTKVPLIIYSNSLKPKSIKALVQHVDIFPTILELLHIPNKYRVDGQSMLPLRDGLKESIRKFAYFEDITYRKLNIPRRTRRRGVRVGDYKYVETMIGNDDQLFSVMPREDLRIIKKELFNLKEDSLEKNNLSRDKQVLSKFSRVLKKVVLDLGMKRLATYKDLNYKVQKSKRIIRDAVLRYGEEKIAIAWKGGKDTTVLMHIIRTMSIKIPFRVMFNDTTIEFDETYKFIDKLSKLWDLDLKIVRHDKDELEEFRRTKDSNRKKELSRMMKITAINKALSTYKFKAFMLGIRRDEHAARVNEKFFSKRRDHMRIHPLLDFTEKDIWLYMKIFGVPYNELYDKGYRSVGEKPFTAKTPANSSERGGRDKEKEEVMEKLRKMGYW
jgi:phosphoadenosine phosphosulfate reductase